MPIYNAAAYVRETVQSVLSQTLAEWELTVVDDGSTDGSGRIVEDCFRDSRIRVIRQENGGVSLARNLGLAHSSGEHVAFLDADDVWLPTNLEKKLARLSDRPESALVHSDVEVIDAESRRTGRIQCGAEGHVLEQLLLWEGDPIPALAANAVIRRSALLAVGTFDPSLSTAADQDLKFRLAARFPVTRLPETLVLYRVHGRNMHQNLQLMERDHLRVYSKALERGMFRSAAFRRRCYSNLFLILAGSWWHGGRPARAIWFGMRALALQPARTAQIARRAMRAASARR
jgi:glycosyltransferase involved in cell wall biosynthesis